MPSFEQVPDMPQSFGYKVLWFAVRACEPVSVLSALEFGEAKLANWASGLAAVYSNEGSQRDDAWVFISPAVSGWILAVSRWFPYPVASKRKLI
jgi:hypothetical protein